MVTKAPVKKAAPTAAKPETPKAAPTAAKGSGAVVLTNLTSNPFILKMDKVVVSLPVGGFVRISKADLDTLLKSPYHRRLIDQEVIRCSHKAADDAVGSDKASDAKAPESLTGAVEQGTVKAEVTKLEQDGAINLGQ
jgi:hypothetical protein